MFLVPLRAASLPLALVPYRDKGIRSLLKVGFSDMAANIKNGAHSADFDLFPASWQEAKQKHFAGAEQYLIEDDGQLGAVHTDPGDLA